MTEDYKMVSMTNSALFEAKVAELLAAGYQCLGDLKIDRQKVPDMSHGGWYWETLYTREFQRQPATPYTNPYANLDGANPERTW